MDKLYDVDQLSKFAARWPEADVDVYLGYVNAGLVGNELYLVRVLQAFVEGLSHAIVDEVGTDMSTANLAVVPSAECAWAAAARARGLHGPRPTSAAPVLGGRCGAMQAAVVATIKGKQWGVMQRQVGNVKRRLVRVKTGHQAATQL